MFLVTYFFVPAVVLSPSTKIAVAQRRLVALALNVVHVKWHFCAFWETKLSKLAEVK
jgi:hypothetical protein